MKNLSNQRNLDKSVFKTLKSSVVDRFTQLVYSVRQGITPPDIAKKSIINEIRKAKNNLKLEVSTRINGFKQLSRNEFAKVLGFKKFVYVGPLDGETRDFCKQHTGFVKTMEEWNKLDNGQKNPVGTYRGGYNCRHSLVGEK